MYEIRKYCMRHIHRNGFIHLGRYPVHGMPKCLIICDLIGNFAITNINNYTYEDPNLICSTYRLLNDRRM